MTSNSGGGIQGNHVQNARYLDGYEGDLSRLIGRYATEFGLIIAILAVIVIAILIDPTNAYLEKPWYNATEILRHASILGIFAMGAGIVIISGGIDLSSGSVIAFSGVICCSLILGLCQYAGLVDDTGNPVTANLPGWILVVAISGTLGVGFIVGSFHAWLITVVRLPPFIATLASLVGLRSLGRVLIQDVNRVFTSNANTQIYIRDATYKSLGNEWYIPVIICAVVALVLFTLMRSTVTGRHLYAIGGNEDAARLSGISIEKKKWLAYCIGTMTAALAGILYSSYVGGAMPDRDGLGYELNAIAAAVVGGCSLAGGLGTISGIVLGAIFLRVVIDAVAKTVKDNPDEFQGMIVGLLVVLAVTFNELRSQKGDRKKFFPGALGIVNIISLTVLMGIVAVLVTSDGDPSTDDSRDKLMAGLVVSGVVCVVLILRRWLEFRPVGDSEGTLVGRCLKDVKDQWGRAMAWLGSILPTRWLNYLIRNYSNFSGRAKRGEYWWYVLICIILWSAAPLADFFMTLSGGGPAGPPVIPLVIGFGLLIPSMALQVRRLHDVGRSGYWSLLNLIPCLGGLILLIWALADSQPGDNQYGPNSKGIAGVSPSSDDEMGKREVEGDGEEQAT